MMGEWRLGGFIHRCEVALLSLQQTPEFLVDAVHMVMLMVGITETSGAIQGIRLPGCHVARID